MKYDELNELDIGQLLVFTSNKARCLYEFYAVDRSKTISSISTSLENLRTRLFGSQLIRKKSHREDDLSKWSNDEIVDCLLSNIDLVDHKDYNRFNCILDLVDEIKLR